MVDDALRHASKLLVGVLGLALIAVTSARLETLAEAQESQLSIQLVETKIKPILSRWQADRGILADPRLVRVISGGLWHFNEIYGWPGNDAALRSRVTQLLNDDDQLYDLIDRFLEDSFSGDEVMTVFARAAQAVGSSSTAAGWPETTKNGFVFVDLSDSIPSVEVTIISESLRSPDMLFATGAVVGAGQHEIVATDGRSWSFRAEGESQAVDRAATGADPLPAPQRA